MVRFCAFVVGSEVVPAAPRRQHETKGARILREGLNRVLMGSKADGYSGLLNQPFPETLDLRSSLQHLPQHFEPPFVCW